MPHVDPRMGGERSNKRVEAGLVYYRERMRAAIRSAMQDEYLVGTEPVSEEEELRALAQREPELWAAAQDPARPAPEQLQFQEALQRLYGQF